MNSQETIIELKTNIITKKLLVTTTIKPLICVKLKNNKIRMKNLFKSIAALALVATIFTSCSKDGDSTTTDPGAPTLTVTVPTSDLNLRFNDVFTTKFNASPATGAKFKSLLVTRTNLTSNISFKLYGDSSTIADSASISRTVNDSILPENANVNDVIAYTIIITDDKGKTATKTFNVTVKDLYSTGQFTIGAPQSTTTEIKFFGLNESAPKSILLYKAGIAIAPDMPSKADSAVRARFNSEKVDFAFFFGTANQNALYSPTYDFGAQNGWNTEFTFWAKRNNTTFKATAYTSSQFSATNFNVEQLINEVDFTTGNVNFVKTLIKGQVVAFKTESGAKGLILVENTATDAKSFAQFSIKWKK
jgi:hypothetical protein